MPKKHTIPEVSLWGIPMPKGLDKIVAWGKKSPLHSSLGIIAGIAYIVGLILTPDIALSVGAILLLAGLVWALFAATKKESPKWEKLVGVIVIIVLMTIGVCLLIPGLGPWSTLSVPTAPPPVTPMPTPLMPTPTPVSLNQYYFKVLTQSAVTRPWNSDVSSDPQSKSPVLVQLEGTCSKLFTLNSGRSRMTAGDEVSSPFMAPPDCNFGSVTLTLQRNVGGDFDDWAFERITLIENNRVLLEKNGLWSIGDSSRGRHLERRIDLRN